MNQVIPRILLVALLLVIGVVLVPPILTNRTGGVSAVIILIGILTSVTALRSPKIGIYLALTEVLFLDYFKKVAVNYGAISHLTIIQVLAVSMATIGCVYLSIAISALFGKIKLTKTDYFLGFSVVAIIGFLFIGSGDKGGLASRVQFAVNSGIYLGLVPAISILFTNLTDLRRLLGFVTVCFTLWAIVGIKQYFFGFSALEWNYAETWLSPVASGHMIGRVDPDPIGLGSGRANYGAIGLFFPIAIWLSFSKGAHRILWCLCAAIIFFGMLVSGQRSMFLLPFIGMAFYFFALKPGRLIVGYLSAFILVLLGVALSQTIQDNLHTINDAIRVEGRLGEVVKVSTFSDRLQGWHRLKDPENYSAFGTLFKGSQYDNVYDRPYHDLLNVVLDDYGLIGLLLLFGTGGLIAFRLHSNTFRMHHAHLRYCATFMLSALVPVAMTSFIGGSNFQTSPINVVLALLLSAYYFSFRLDQFLFQEESKDTGVSEEKNESGDSSVKTFRKKELGQTSVG